MSDSRRALCIVPPTGRYIRESRCQTPIDELKTITLRPPIDLLYAAACFERGGCETRVTDYPAVSAGWDDLRRELTEFAPDFLILEITTPTLEDDLRAAEIAKEVDASTTTIAKGAHFSVFDGETLKRHPELDLVLRGEYEWACLELAGGADPRDVDGVTYRDDVGGVVRTQDRAFSDDLDALPFPSRHLIDNALYTRPDTGAPQTTVVTNRGCPHSCVFCLASQVAGHKNRYRSVENVVAELRECVEQHGIRSFLFRSDLFTLKKEWVIELCRSIIDEGLEIDWAANSRVDSIDAETAEWMKRAGCWIVAFGVESGIDEHLQLMNKRAESATALSAIRTAREAGLLTSVYMLMGLPWDTVDSIKQNVRFFKELDADVTEIFYIYPFPGTPLHDLAVEKGLLEANAIPSNAYDSPAMATEAMSVEELAHWRKWALRRLYFRPGLIARTLWRAMRQGTLLKTIRFGLGKVGEIVSAAKTDNQY